VFNAAGGWDTTYLMDLKRVGGINRLYEEEDDEEEHCAANAAEVW